MRGAGVHGQGGQDLRTEVSLLPTATAMDAHCSGGSSPANVTLTDAVVRTDMGREANSRHDGLLPTPTAGTNAKSRRAMTSSTENGRRSGGGQSSPLGLEELSALIVGEIPASGVNGNGMGKPLAIAAAELLPTPQVADVTGGHKHRSGDRAGEPLLPGAVDEVHFGKYGRAIARTEIIVGRPAPAPAIPDGRNGKRRLHSKFVEWMMLLPEGHVTGRGLGRSAELARLGNGVVPLQAAFAVSDLMRQVAGQ